MHAISLLNGINNGFYLDYIPIISTFVNLSHLFQKCVIKYICDETILKIHYFKMIKEKSAFRCVLLLFPFIGNLVIAIHDTIRYQKLKTQLINEELNKTPIEKEFDRLKKEADLNQPESCLGVSLMYNLGQGTTLDLQKAEYYLTKAGQLGSPLALHLLGEKYYTQHPSTTYFLQAAERGSVYSYYRLGQIYESVKTAALSLSYYEKAANSGCRDSILQLGRLYLEGAIIAVNYEVAFQWFKKGAQLGDASCMTHLGYMFEKEYLVSSEGNTAHYWYSEAAKLNDSIASQWLAAHKPSTTATETNLDVLYKLAEQNDSNAMYRLGVLFHDANNIYKDEEKGYEWMAQAADLNNIDALTWLSDVGDDVKASYQLGGLYENGSKEVKIDLKEALHWYMEGAKKGHQKSMLKVGFFIEEGKGTEADPKLAEEWIMAGKKIG